MTGTISAAPYGTQSGGRRHRVTVKKMKKVLKKAGLKVTGKRATLTRRIKKAHLKMRGGEKDPETAPAPEVKEDIEGVVEEVKKDEAPEKEPETTEGGRRRSRKGKKGKKGSRRH